MRRLAVFALVAFACMGSSALAGNLSGKTVVIDPGHNGGNTSHHEITGKQVWAGTLWKDCDADGASTDSGYSEAQHNWDVAVLVRSLLRAQGARVVLTRTSNTGAG
ncbi:MAG: N-acetylmuramoyl-L-alanine amidase, partial [Thermoleophilia bacterium]|nr:N-acetylmuramoyl-L-alanine amidase [Thermoleophilia bacterium]